MWKDRIVGQHKIRQSLRNSIVQGSLTHALILEGKTGYGSLPLALSVTQSLLCTSTEHVPCGQCKSCNQVDQLIHPDLHIAFPVVKKEGIERKNTTSKDFMNEWRNLVIERPYLSFNEWIRSIAKTSANADINVKECSEIIQQLNLQSYTGNKKVQIIWIADHLGSNGNKLLKLIEEPPVDTHLILIVERLETLLKTIVSRCQVIRVPRIQEGEIVSILKSSFSLSDQVAAQVALLSNGDLRQAMTYSNFENNDMLDICLNWMQLCKKKDLLALRNWTSEFGRYNMEEQKAVLQYLLKLIQSILYAQILGPNAIRLTNSDKAKIRDADLFGALSLDQAQEFTNIVGIMVDRIERYVPGRMAAFDGSLRIIELIYQQNLVDSYT